MIDSDLLNRKSSSLRVDRFSATDRPALDRFFDRAWDDPAFFKHRWQWQFVENPEVAGEVAPIWVFKKDAEIIGQITAMPGRIKVGDRIHTVWWLVDYKVARRYEMMGLVLFLMREVEKEPRLMMALGISDKSESIFRALSGWKGERRIPMLTSRAEALLKEPAQGREEGICRPVTRFEVRHGDFARDLLCHYPICAIRTPEVMTWRYLSYDYLRHAVLEVVDVGRLRGMAFLRFQETPKGALGTVVDLLADPADEHVIHRLLIEAAGSFHRWGISRIRAYFTEPRIRGAMKRFGFEEEESKTLFMYANHDPDVSDAILESPDNWFMTMHDGDIGTLRW